MTVSKSAYLGCSKFGSASIAAHPSCMALLAAFCMSMSSVV